MFGRDQTEWLGREDPGERFIDGLREPSILPPHDFMLIREGNALRPIALDRGKTISSGALSSATKYVFRWVAELDLTTREKVEAGFARATLLGEISRSYVEREALYGPLLTDAKFSSGYFFCVGADNEGNVSDFILATNQTDTILDGALPGPVTELQVSESGEPQNDTVESVLSFTYVSPRTGTARFIGIKPVIRDYPAIGDLTNYSPLLYGGPPRGGAGGGLLRIPVARRTGNGTISIAGTAVTGVGSNFTQFAKADDQLEVFNVRRRIASVNSDTSITLTAAWPSTPAVAAVGQYLVIGKCRVYAVSLAQNLAHTLDEAVWPFVDVDIDGELSAPNAPAALTLIPYGNGIRGQFVQVAGLGIKGYLVFRSTGSTNDITTATQIGKEIRHDPTTPNGGTVLQFEDSKFTTYERENGQVFRYYVKTVNVRDDPSSGYATATAACRLDSGADGGDPVGKLGLKNLLFNGSFSGTMGSVVAPNLTTQYTTFGRVVIGTHQPGRPYSTVAGHGGQAAGLGDYRGYTAWESNDGGTGAAGVGPTFEENDEVHIPAPGAGNIWYLLEEIEAWDTGLGGVFVKVHKDGTCCWQVKLARQIGGSQPNGTIGIYIDLYDNNTFRGEAPRRYRDSATDVYQYATGGAAHIDVAGADLVTDWRLYYGLFKLDSSLGVIRQVRVNVLWADGTQGTVRVKEAMVNDGEERGAYTPDMGDPTVAWPIPGHPAGELGDGNGKRDGSILVP